MTGFEVVPEGLWPYLVLLLVAVLPTEIWRMAAVFLVRGLSDRSEIFAWVRAVATTLIAAVIAKLIFNPMGALAEIPLFVRLVAIGATFLVFFLVRRSVPIALTAGIATLLILAHSLPQ